MFGIVEFNSIINQPNSAILSVGAIVEKPVVKNGQIVVGNTMMLSLACDHRTVDGATGALFQTLKQYIENGDYACITTDFYKFNPSRAILTGFFIESMLLIDTTSP
jgi:hypothetical protein